jgi:predicted dehydrogenase
MSGCSGCNLRPTAALHLDNLIWEEMTQNKLNVGVIGAGFIGQIAHISTLQAVASCNLYALAELRPKLRQKVVTRYGFDRGYENHQQLITDPNVDAVVVVVPRPYTAQIVEQCLLAGKHVLSEKPMAGNAKESERLVAMAHKRDLRYCVGYMKRYDEGVLKCRTLVQQLRASKKLGRIIAVAGHCYMGDSYCNASGHEKTDEAADYDMVPGAIAPYDFDQKESELFARYLNVYSHLTNLFEFLFESTPTVEYFNSLLPNSQLAVFNYGDFIATLHTGEAANREWDEGVCIQFEGGKLTLTMPPALLRPASAKVTLYCGDTQQREEYLMPWRWAFSNQAQAFVDDVLLDRPSVIDAKFALNQIRLIEKCWARKYAG